MTKFGDRLRFPQSTAILAILILLVPAGFAQSDAYHALWQDPEITTRIEEGIKANRMGWLTVRILDADGKPVPNAHVAVEHTRHAFLFGANIFMLGGFDTAEKNRRYEETFTSLFNFATIPFYWKTLEPEPGKLRFTADSEPIHRRPPPDVAVEFCRNHGITPKGHPLVWDSPHWQVPEWLPKDPDKIAPIIRRRIEQIAERYRDSIRIWDVVNEVLLRKTRVPMPDDFVRQAFQVAGQAFPPESTLILNEAHQVFLRFREDMSPFYLVLQNQLQRGSRIDAIGIQCHFFGEQYYQDVRDGKIMQPLAQYAVLDRYADFHKPIHITEITVPTITLDAAGEKVQAEVTRNIYRLWFSHPNVEAITWWNVADGTAVPGENKLGGGLVRSDFTPKASYKALDELINHEWRTRTQFRGDDAGRAKFRGFYGDYKATITIGGKTVTRTFQLRKGGPKEVTFTTVQ